MARRATPSPKLKWVVLLLLKGEKAVEIHYRPLGASKGVIGTYRVRAKDLGF